MKSNIKKRGYHWFRMLTKKQKKQYRENVKNSKFVSHDHDSYIAFKKNKSDTAWGFIAGSFSPYESPQGTDYWDKVINMLENN